jgi:hypothetical protein
MTLSVGLDLENIISVRFVSINQVPVINTPDGIVSEGFTHRRGGPVYTTFCRSQRSFRGEDPTRRVGRAEARSRRSE